MRWMVLATLIVFNSMPGFVATPLRAQNPPPPEYAKKRQTGDDFLSPASGALTVAKLLDLLRLVRQDIETEGRILRAIEARPLDFPMTPANSLALTAAGASPKLLELLRRKAPPPSRAEPPATPKVEEKPNGVLRLQCEPAECEVAVGNGAFLTTEGGAIITKGLRPGQAVAVFRKKGYVSQNRDLTIGTEDVEALVVKLEPDFETRIDFGKRLFDAMMNAAGRNANQKVPSDLFASGSVTVFEAAGSGTEWNITVALEALQNTIDVKSSGGEMRLDCRGETCQMTEPGGRLFSRRLGRDQIQNLETNLRQFRKYQFSALLDHLASSVTRALANTATMPAAGDLPLRLETGGEAYSILLSAEFLPTLITFESKTGVGAGVSIAFADYMKFGVARYPRATEIKFPDGKQGLRVRFDELGQKRVR